MPARAGGDMLNQLMPGYKDKLWARYSDPMKRWALGEGREQSGGKSAISLANRSIHTGSRLHPVEASHLTPLRFSLPTGVLRVLPGVLGFRDRVL